MDMSKLVGVSHIRLASAGSVEQAVTPSALGGQRGSSNVPLGRKVAEFFKHTPSPEEQAAKQKNQEFKAAVSRALLKVDVTPRWEGQPAVRFPAASFGEVRASVLDRHGVDLLPLALGGKPLPDGWLRSMEQGYAAFKSDKAGWGGVAHNAQGRIVAVTADDMRAVYGEVLRAKPEIARQVYLEDPQKREAIRVQELFEARLETTPLTVRFRDFGRPYAEHTFRNLDHLLRTIDIEKSMGLKTLDDVARINPRAPWLTIPMRAALDDKRISLDIGANQIRIDKEQRNGQRYIPTKDDPIDPELLKSEITIEIDDVGGRRKEIMTVKEVLNMLGVKHPDNVVPIHHTEIWRTVTVDEVFDLDEVKRVINDAVSQIRAEITSGQTGAAAE